VYKLSYLLTYLAVHVDGGLRAVLSEAVLAGTATPLGKSAHAV